MTIDWKDHFLAAKGRIGRRDFWIGAVALIVVGVIAGMIPVIGPLASLALLLPWTCLMAKRLHDFGRSGWLVLVPAVPTALSSGLALVAALAISNAATLGLAFGLGGVALTVASVSALIGLGFLLWVGLTAGDPRPNRFGAPVESAIGLGRLGA